MTTLTSRPLAFLARASTPPAEERVTSFFARAKKKVTKKESTLRNTPGFTYGDSVGLRRSQLRVRRVGSTAWPIAICYRRCCFTAALVMAPIQWAGRFRAHPDVRSSSSEAQNNVLAFGDFALHGQRKVTRSTEGRVEAPELQQSLRKRVP